jgi:hypothetical protein
MTNQTREGGSSGTLNLLLDSSPHPLDILLEDGSDCNITLLYIQFCRLGRHIVERLCRPLTRGYRWVQLPKANASGIHPYHFLLSSVVDREYLTPHGKLTAGGASV